MFVFPIFSRLEYIFFNGGGGRDIDIEYVFRRLSVASFSISKLVLSKLMQVPSQEDGPIHDGGG